jgi:hypothetical protein
LCRGLGSIVLHLIEMCDPFVQLLDQNEALMWRGKVDGILRCSDLFDRLLDLLDL